MRIALWCNGSTSDSGSACEGSSPSKATQRKVLNSIPFFFISGTAKKCQNICELSAKAVILQSLN